MGTVTLWNVNILFNIQSLVKILAGDHSHDYKRYQQKMAYKFPNNRIFFNLFVLPVVPVRIQYVSYKDFMLKFQVSVQPRTWTYS